MEGDGMKIFIIKSGTTPFGDVWVPAIHHFKIPLVGDPTRPDRPGDMYDAETVGAEKDLGPATGVAINGISIQVTRTKLGRSNT